MNFDEQPKTDMADDIPSESLHDYCLKLGLQVRDGNNGNSKMAVGTSAAQSENTQGNGRPISPRHAKLNQLANDATKKSFACKNCGKAFANSRQFLKHKCSSKVKSEEDSVAKPRRKPGRPRKQRGNGNKAAKTVVKDKGDTKVVKQAAESNGQTSAKSTDEAQLAVVHLADHTYIRDELEANDDGTRSTDSATAADCAEECSEKAEAKQADDKSCSTLQPEPVPKTDELSQKSPGEKDEELMDNASAVPESKPAVDDEATSGKTSVSGGLKRKYSFKNEEVTCPHCNKGFHFKKRLERHVKICGRNLVCEFCGEDFNNGGKHSYSKYEQHYYTHVEKKPHPCTVCSQSFVRKQDLDKHKVIHTTEFVPRTCLQCGAVFSSDKLLSKHAKKHEKPLWSCPKCQQQFVRQVIFEKHVKACQTQVSCEVCGKVFQCLSKNLKSRYQEHMFTHTGEKPYKCQFCERAFRDRSTRKKHERSHTGEKPYPCTLCDRAFSQLRLLRNHVRTHTGEKPYECNLCELAFAKQCNLKYHMRVHTKEKPYTCQLCSKSFTQSGTYHKHMRRHNQTSTNTSTTAENTSPSTPSTSAGVSVVPVPLQETALSDVQAPVEVTPDTTTEAEVSTSTHVIQEIPISNNEITIIVSEGVDGAAASLATIDVEQISSLLASCS